MMIIHTRNGSNKAGPQDGRLVQCALKPANHGFYPESEACPYCEPSAEPETLVPPSKSAGEWEALMAKHGFLFP